MSANRVHYLQSDKFPNHCHYYHNASTVLPSGLLQVTVDTDNLRGISEWTLYLIYGCMFSCFPCLCAVHVKSIYNPFEFETPVIELLNLSFHYYKT